MTYRNYQQPNLLPLWILMGLNILFFIATIIVSDLIVLLGLIPAFIIERPWTIVTSMFLHGGIWHILANMITMYFFGRYLCLLIGEKKFLISYFIGGIVGSIFFALLGPPLSIGICASGAVFALGGTLAAMRPKLKVIVFPIPVPLPLWAAVIGGFVVMSFLAKVTWQAHLGGLLSGLAMGYLLRKRTQFF